MPYYIKRKPAEKKTKSRETNLVKKLDTVFSAYIRLRDVMPNGCFQCISCGHIFKFEDGDCGHFHSRVHMATRWEPDNCHFECKGCNRFSADHIIKYQVRLIRKIGQERFDRLTLLADSQKHWMQFELKDMIDKYTAEVKRLSAEKGIKVRI